MPLWIVETFDIIEHIGAAVVPCKGNCFDNAIVQTFFKTLKSELVWRTVFMTGRLPRLPSAAMSIASRHRSISSLN